MPHNGIGQEQPAGSGFGERDETEARRVGGAEPLQHSLDNPEVDLTDDRRITTGRVQQGTAAQCDASLRVGFVVGREAEAGQRVEHGLPRIAAGAAALVDEFASPLDAGGTRVALRVRAGASQLSGQSGRQTRVVTRRHRGVGGRCPVQRGRTSASGCPGGGAFDEPKLDDRVEMFANGVGVQVKSRGGVSDPDGGVCAHVVEHPQPLPGQRHGRHQHRRRPGAQDDRLFFHGIYCSKLLGDAPSAMSRTRSASVSSTERNRKMPANDVIVASTAADAEAVEAITSHHAQLAGQLAVLTDAMVSAVERGADFEPTRVAALAFLAGELLPHAAAEEERLYPAATRTQRARPLIESMIAAHRIIGSLVDGIRTEPPVRAAGSAQALRVLFDAHLVDENERILPIVAADPDVSLVEVTHGMHELLGHPHTTNGAEPSHNCGCGETDADDPVLDVRDVPHSIRHATVFGAFDAVPDGGALVLVAPHDPIPLLRQLDHRTSGRLEIRYEQRGPEAWRLRLIKR